MVNSTEGIIIQSGDIEWVPGRDPRIRKKDVFVDGAGGNHFGRNISEIPQGVSCGLHSHRSASETFTVISGTGDIQIGDKIHHVCAGHTVVVPNNVPHNLTGTSEDPFVVMCDLYRADDPTPWVS